MLIAPIVDLHRDDHGNDADGSPSHLPQQKEISGPIALFRHHSGCTEHHYQANKYQKQCYGKHPAVDTDTLSHGRISFHHAPGKNEVFRSAIVDCLGTRQISPRSHGEGAFRKIYPENRHAESTGPPSPCLGVSVVEVRVTALSRFL